MTNKEQMRSPNGRFKKSRIKSLLGWIIFLAITAYIIYGVYIKETPSVTSQDAPTATIAPRDEESTVMDENDAKKVELYKKKVILERKKKVEEDRHAKVIADEKALNDANMKSIEAELEAVRGEELSF